MSEKLPYFRVLDDQTKTDTSFETIDGTGFSDSLKASRLKLVVIQNKTFKGSPSENHIDLVQGEHAVLGPNYFEGSPGVANITVKGGFSGLGLVGNFGTLEWGQYSNYDRWFKLPKSKGLHFHPQARGRVTVWFAEKPEYIPPGVKVTVIPSLIVRLYFTWRSLCQSIGLP